MTTAMKNVPTALCVLFLASCVSQQEFDEAKELARHYQMRMHDLERANARLEADSEALKTELAMGGAAALEAGFGQDFEDKLAEYERMLGGLSGPLADAQRFDLEDGSTLYMVPDAILFDSGSADLGAEGRKKLTQIAKEIEARPHGRVWVRGHTDSDRVVKPATKARFPHGNLDLSSRRAVEVAALLTQAGIPEEAVAVIGFGPYLPLRPNDSADNKRLNRRVEIYVSKAE